ncbi:hypothetical protein IC066_001146 [Salmonella enterica]|nr:hypothetical protein [Salmonella enterica]
MKEFNLPALEYCSLERATRFIGDGCEIGDLLHWAEIGAIKLSYDFSKHGYMDYPAYLEFSGNIFDIANNILSTGQCYDFFINLSPHSIVSTCDFEKCTTVEDVVSALTKTGDRPSTRGCLNGVWDISKLTVNRKHSEPYRISECSPSGSAYVNCNASLGASDCEPRYSANDLLISKQAISTILGDDIKLRSIPITRHVPYCSGKKSSTDKEEISKTIANNRASLIKALLAIHYGDDVADNPRKFIENKDSEICKDFQLKGISLPSGKTIADWLKDADIDFT